MKVRNLFHLRSHLFEKNRCFIPKCKAHCCANAPLPEGYAEKMRELQVRKVYYYVNIGKNSPNDPYNSVISNTRPIPIVFIGHDIRSGGGAFHFNKEFANALGIKSQDEAIEKLMELEAKRVYNYCPFLNVYGKCEVYNRRPPICREFGTVPTPINHCSDKSSRFDIMKFYLKATLKEMTPKKVFVFYKDLIVNAVKKTKNTNK